MVKIVRKVKIDTVPKDARKASLWKGPEQEGVTFSLLSRWLTCRERFRLYALDGLAPAPLFNHRIEYGSMWHVCEEAYASSGPLGWRQRLQIHAGLLAQNYPMDRDAISHWARVCSVQFPLYLEYWEMMTGGKKRAGKDVSLYEEQTFAVPYALPSGRKVILRGKWDSVFTNDDGRTVWLFEHKTKGDVNGRQIQRQLTFDLQTMLYVVALRTYLKNLKGKGGRRHPLSLSRVAGVRYNVVRRPLSGGKGSIVRHKATKNKPEESEESFYGRLEEVIKADMMTEVIGGHVVNPDSTFFMRWDVVLGDEDVVKFRHQCLDPMLENLCGWYDFVTTGRNPYASVMPMNWRHPFGVFNVLDEGGSSDLDEYLATGSEVGLSRVDNLFPELT